MSLNALGRAARTRTARTVVGAVMLSGGIASLAACNPVDSLQASAPDAVSKGGATELDAALKAAHVSQKSSRELDRTAHHKLAASSAEKPAKSHVAAQPRVQAPAQPSADRSSAQASPQPSPVQSSTPVASVASSAPAQAPQTASKPTPAVTTTTPAAPSAGGSCVKPGSANTGASGTLASSSVTTAATNGQVIQNVVISGGLEISGDNVTVRNVRVDGGILVTGRNSVIDHVTSTGIGISGATGTKVQYNNIMNSPEDGLHVTSDRGPVSNVTLSHNYVHAPNVPSDAHYDGIQVRGVDGLTVDCNTIDTGAYKPMYNSVVYLEDANGGDRNVTVSNNWLNGAGYTLMLDATNLSVTGNKFGTGEHWGLCDNRANSGGTAAFTSKGNVLEATGAAVNLCGQG